jgi:hypothetical protein
MGSDQIAWRPRVSERRHPMIHHLRRGSQLRHQQTQHGAQARENDFNDGEQRQSPVPFKNRVVHCENLPVNIGRSSWLIDRLAGKMI